MKRNTLLLAVALGDAGYVNGESKGKGKDKLRHIRVTSTRKALAMKKVLFVLLLVVVVVGFYRGWFVLTSHSRDESNKVDVNLTMDPDKAKEDAEKMKDKATELGDRASDTVKQDNP